METYQNHSQHPGLKPFLSSGEALVWVPSSPEVTSLLVVEIVAGRGCLLQQVVMSTDVHRQTSPKYIMSEGVLATKA